MATVYDFVVLSWRHPNRIDWNCESYNRKSFLGIERLHPADARWFVLFKYKTPEEALELLVRLRRVKKAQRRWISPGKLARSNRRRRRKNRESGTKWDRLTRHHIDPCARGGDAHFRNMLCLNDLKHKSWHDWVGLATLDEVIVFMRRWVESRASIAA